MIKSKFEGKLTIGDNMYLEQMNQEERFKKLVFTGDFNSEVEVSSVDLNDEKMAIAMIHLYNGEKQLGFDLVEGRLDYLKGAELIDTKLRCDTASFQIIGKNNVTISTLSDGYYGDGIQLHSGETILAFYVTHDSMYAHELQESIIQALGIEEYVVSYLDLNEDKFKRLHFTSKEEAEAKYKEVKKNRSFMSEMIMTKKDYEEHEERVAEMAEMDELYEGDF